MKRWIIILFFPFFATAQTVHVNDGEVEYKGSVKLKGLSKDVVWARAQEALQPIFGIKEAEKDADKNEMEAEGRMRLEMPYRIIRQVVYRLKLEAKNDELEYKIDKVYLQETQRGFDTKTTPSKDLIDALEEGGAVVKETEKILNETDMRFQEMFARLKTFLNNR